MLEMLRRIFGISLNEKLSFLAPPMTLETPENLKQIYFLSHNNCHYLICCTEHGEPYLKGKLVRKIRKKRCGYYTARIRPDKEISYKEKAEINSKLSKFWSDSNLEEIIKKSLKNAT